MYSITVYRLTQGRQIVLRAGPGSANCVALLEV
jgi:hypothetical protein